MNAAEQIIDSRKTSEIMLLRAYVEKMGRMECSRVVWGELHSAPEICACPSCQARETLATVGLMAEVYRGAGYAAQG